MKIIKPFGRLAKALIGLALLSTSPSYAAPNTLAPLGINTNELVEFDASAPFVNIFRSSLPFEEARPWLTKKNVQYDKDGWPTNLNGGQAGTRFLNKLPVGTIPDGNYTVLYDGRGKIRYGNDAKLVSRTPGREIIAIKAGKDKILSATLMIMETDTRNPLRNIRILMPGGICSNNPRKRVYDKRSCRGSQFLSFEKHHERIIFNPDYLDYMKDFRVLRFMNMSGITRNPRRFWSQRPTMSKASWGGKEGSRGAPVEIMVALANMNKSDAWFSMPHAADDNYIRQFARYVKQNLRPGLKAYVEYTNEAWNTIFTQAHYMKDMGLKHGLDTDRDKAGYKYFSWRSTQVFDLWEREFGGTKRIVRVMGGWTGYTRLTEMLLSYRDAYKKIDAYAIAPYFYGDHKKIKTARSVNEVFKMLYDPKLVYSIPGVKTLIKKHAALAKAYGLDLIAYEGGQHLVDWKNRDINKAPTKYFIAANRDWRMARAYKDFLDGWREAGGKLFVAFSAPRVSAWYGSWGTREYITQSDRKAPKHRALLNYIRKNRCWWRGCTSAEIVRYKKPAINPGRGVYALVPSKSYHPIEKKKKPKPVQVAKTSTPTKSSSAKTSNGIPVWEAITVPNARPAARKANNPPKKAAPLPPPPIVVLPLPQQNNNNRQIPTYGAANSGYTNFASNKVYDGTIPMRRPGQLVNSPRKALRNIVGGNINGSYDLAATWETSWDKNYLYLRVDASDDQFVRDSGQPWGDDSIEVFIDADGSRYNRFDGLNDFHMIFRWRDQRVNLSQNSPRGGDIGIQHQIVRHATGYTLEAAIPWRTLGVIPQQGSVIGMEVHVNDDDTGQGRDGKLAWFSRNDDAWRNPQNFGRMLLGN